MKTEDIRKAWMKIREIDNTIPDEVIDFMKDSAISAINGKKINLIPKGHYNEAPEGLIEITLEEWQRGMFLYSLEKSHSKQVRRNGQIFDLRLFDVPNFKNDKIGFAIMNDWFDSETGRNREKNIVRFCRYGTEQQWKDFDRAFVAQFAGDNS